jgi:shikimate dehydrogenase
VNISSKTKLFGIMGNPVSHSLSPQMHAVLAADAGFDAAYLAFEIAAGDLGAALGGAKKMGALGFNVTAPYKIEVLQYLDEIDPEAASIGSVNTVVNRGGRWFGYSTDGDGFVDSLLLEGVPVEGKRILMLGAGGSARAIAYALAKKGAAEIYLTGSPAKIGAIEACVAENTRTKTKILRGGAADAFYDMIINATPLGMHPHEGENPFDGYDCIRETNEKPAFCDLIYNPKETLFLQEARRRFPNAKRVNGLPMLVWQGILAFERFTGKRLPNRKGAYEKLLNVFGGYRI